MEFCEVWCSERCDWCKDSMRFIYLWSILTKKGEKYVELVELGEAGYWLRWMNRSTTIIGRSAQVLKQNVSVGLLADVKEDV